MIYQTRPGASAEPVVATHRTVADGGPRPAYSASVQVAVLGPVAAERDGAPVALGAPKQRSLLAALALHAGRPVPADALVDLLWGDDAPAAAGASLQTYVA